MVGTWLKIIGTFLLLIAPFFPQARALAGKWICDGERGCRYVPEYHWRQLEGDPDRDYLYDGDRQVGGWCYRDCHYRSYDVTTKTWGPAQPEAPVRVPGRFNPAPEPIAPPRLLPDAPPDIYLTGEPPPLNFGLDVDRVRKYCAGGKCRYSINGKEVTKEQAYASLEATGLTDDEDFLRITFIGPATVADTIAADLLAEPLKSAWAGRCLLQTYTSPDEPMVKGLGFEPGRLYVQLPGGKAVHRQDGYRGPEKLAEALQLADARRRDPSFDPTKIPDLNLPKPDAPTPAPSLPSLPSIPGWLAALLAALAVYFLRGPRDPKPAV
jgi:hypothetical protein